MTNRLALAAISLIVMLGCSDAADTSVENRAPASRSGDTVTAAERTRRSRPFRGDSLAQRACGITERTVLTPQGIGDLRIGTTVSQVRARCRVLRDSTGTLEGMPMPLVVVDLARDTVLAETAGDRIFRLRIEDAAFRTADGLGVGSTIGDLRTRGSTRVARGEGTFILLDYKCGLSFELGDPRVARALPARVSAEDMPQDIRVVRVLVYACEPARPPPALP